MFRYLIIFFWIEAIIVLSLGCTAPRERRGDWMEHLNSRQFTYNAPMIHWNRSNYYSHEELREIWKINMDRILASYSEE